MYKFRTMVDGADDAVHREFVTAVLRPRSERLRRRSPEAVDDDRVTWVGSFLRRLSLTSCHNSSTCCAATCRWSAPVLRSGWEVRTLPAGAPATVRRQAPMTGLWQVSGRSQLAMTQALDLDVEYVERRTFWFDVSIVLRTIPVILSRRGAT